MPGYGQFIWFIRVAFPMISRCCSLLSYGLQLTIHGSASTCCGIEGVSRVTAWSNCAASSGAGLRPFPQPTGLVQFIEKRTKITKWKRTELNENTIEKMTETAAECSTCFHFTRSLHSTRNARHHVESRTMQTLRDHCPR